MGERGRLVFPLRISFIRVGSTSATWWRSWASRGRKGPTRRVRSTPWQQKASSARSGHIKWYSRIAPSSKRYETNGTYDCSHPRACQTNTGPEAIGTWNHVNLGLLVLYGLCGAVRRLDFYNRGEQTAHHIYHSASPPTARNDIVKTRAQNFAPAY